MSLINFLTPEQERKLKTYSEEWIAKGLATDPNGPDKPACERAVKLAYHCAGLRAPQKFIWTQSPLHNCVARISYIGDSVRDSVGASVRASVGTSVGASVGTSVRDSVGDSVGTSVWDSVWASVGASVGASVVASVWDSVWASVWASVGASVRASVRDSVRDSVYGSHEAHWLAYYSFFHNELKIDLSVLNGVWACMECGWFIPLENVCIICPKPKSIKTRINERGCHELHADGEAAVYYCDDFQIYAYKGVRLPKKIGSVPSKEWDPEWIFEQPNQEIRRLLLETMPAERMQEHLMLRVLDSFISSRSRYELVEAMANPYPSPYKALRFRCPSTDRLYLIRVHPEIATAEAAITALNGGVHPDQFAWEH